METWPLHQILSCTHPDRCAPHTSPAPCRILLAHSSTGTESKLRIASRHESSSSLRGVSLCALTLRPSLGFLPFIRLVPHRNGKQYLWLEVQLTCLHVPTVHGSEPRNDPYTPDVHSSTYASGNRPCTYYPPPRILSLASSYSRTYAVA